jgi:hypothetical protein
MSNVYGAVGGVRIGSEAETLDENLPGLAQENVYERRNTVYVHYTVSRKSGGFLVN